MSALLLDTSLLIDLERGAISRSETIGDDDDPAIAAITLAELRVGALLATGRAHQAQSDYVDDIAGSVPILPYDQSVAEVHARLLVEVRRQGRPRGAHDLVIAATAAAHDRTIVSADSSAFEGLPGVITRSHRR